MGWRLRDKRIDEICLWHAAGATAWQVTLAALGLLVGALAVMPLQLSSGMYYIAAGLCAYVLAALFIAIRALAFSSVRPGICTVTIGVDLIHVALVLGITLTGLVTIFSNTGRTGLGLALSTVVSLVAAGALTVPLNVWAQTLVNRADPF